MPITVKSQGKKFTFADGTPESEIGAAIDSYFSNQGAPQQQAPRQPNTEGLDETQIAKLDALKLQFDQENQARVEANAPSPGQSLLIGAGKGLTDVGRFFTGLVGGGPSDAQVQGEQQAFDELKETNPITSRVGEFIGETVGTAPLGGFAGAIGKKVLTGTALKLGAAAGGRVATTAGVAGMGAAEGAAVATQLGEDVTTGAALGAGAGVLMPVIFRAGKNAFQRITGRSATSEIFDATTGELTEYAAKELQDAGIPIETFAGEVEALVKNNFNPELDMAAQVRAAQAQEFAPGVVSRPSRLAKDIGAQSAEEQLIVLNTAEGRNIVTNDALMQEGLQIGAQTKLLGDLDVELISNFNTISNDANKGILGASAKSVLSDIKVTEKQAVDDLYKAARDMAGDGQQVTTKNVLAAFEVGANDLAPTDGLMSAVGRSLKEYNVIEEGTALADEFKFKAPKELKDLTLDNAESLRQRLNVLDPRDGSQDSLFVSRIRAQLDNEVDGLIDMFPEEGAVAAAFKAARAASAKFKTTFNDKRLVSDLINFKKGSDVDKVAPELILDKMLRSPMEGVKQVKSLMLDAATPESTKAWNEIKFTVIDDLMRGAMDRNTGNISGARLNTALAKIGDERLKLILGNEKFAQVKRFQQVVSDQTIPLKSLANPSGSSGPIIRTIAALGDILKGSANASTGGLVSAAGKGRAQRNAIETALNEIKTATGKSGRVKRLLAQKKVAEYFNVLGISGAATAGGSDDSN